jgi:capsular polysaccharide biosynthesis protein
MKSRRSIFTGVIFLVAGTGFIAAGLSMLLQPKVYKSGATIQANTSEFEVIRSHAVLSNVVAKLNLDEVWGNKYNRGRRLSYSEAEEVLKQRLRLRNIENTHFIEISVYTGDPNEAAALANAIAKTYDQYRRAEELRRLAESYPPGVIADPLVAIMDYAIPEFKPVRPRYRIASLVMILGAVLVIPGIIALNCSEE